MTKTEQKYMDAFTTRYVDISNQVTDPVRQIEAFEALDKELKAEFDATNAKIESKANFRGELIATFGVAAGIGATLLGMPTLPAVIGTGVAFYYAEKKRTAYAVAQKIEKIEYRGGLAFILGQVEASEERVIRDNLDTVLRDEKLFTNLPHLREKWMKIYKQQTPPAASSAPGPKKGM